MKRALVSVIIAGAATLLSGCMVGPNYQRPKVTVPAVYRNPAPTAPTSAALGGEQWVSVFRDPALQQLIRTAVQHNYDVRIAATRVQQAQALAGITRSEQFPAVNAGVNLFAEHNPKSAKPLPAYRAQAGTLDASVIWHLDFWGKYRRQTQAARDQMLATEWGQKAVIASVVSGVAAAYYQWRELRDALYIAQQTLATRQRSLQLVQVLNQNGSASELELSQAQELVAAAAETVPALERQIAQQENLISALTGENPAPVTGDDTALAPLPDQIPAGLPSALLERRPDIREAEANLMAATANIGVAKAALFPDIALTATGGAESYALNRLFTAPSALWNVTGAAVQPIFRAGALRAGVRLTQAQEEEMVLSYQQTIQQALREVSDGLIAYQKDREFAAQQQQLTTAAQDADRLSNILYQHGGASYLQVLTSETNAFAAQLNLVQARLNERLALVQVYSALGGGWQ